MDYSTNLLSEIEKHAREMMTPTEIAALLGIEERTLCDDVSTVGHPARKAYIRGTSITALELRSNIHVTALAGSSYSIQECQRLLAVAQSAINS